MQNSQAIADRIKSIAKSQKIPISKMLIDCELNKNAIFTMQSKGHYPKIEALIKIADYLDCSVDYLLGRDKFYNNIATGNVSNNNNVGNIDNSISIGANQQADLPKQEQDLIKIYQNSDGKTQTKIMQFMYDLEERK